KSCRNRVLKYARGRPPTPPASEAGGIPPNRWWFVTRATESQKPDSKGRRMAKNQSQFWRYVRALAAPVLLWVLFAALLLKPLKTWLKGDKDYDEAAMQEWIEETRGFHETLPEMVRDYFRTLDQAKGVADG